MSRKTGAKRRDGVHVRQLQLPKSIPFGCPPLGTLDETFVTGEAQLGDGIGSLLACTNPVPPPEPYRCRSGVWIASDPATWLRPLPLLHL